jgi:hypothetical protein
MMLRNFKKTKLVFLAVFSSLLVSVSAFAQIPRMPQIPQTPQLLESQVTLIQLRNATTRLNRLETLLNQVESKRVATLQDTEEVEQAAFAYAEAMKAGLDNALRNADILARTQGRQGSISPLETFEKAEQANQPRLEKIAQRTDTIERQIKGGAIRVDQSIIQNLSVPERRNLLESLEPPVQQIYLREQPALFKPVLEAPVNLPLLEVPRDNLKFLEDTSDKFQSFVPENTQNKLSSYDIGVAVSSMMQSINNMLIPPAYAIAAAPCVGLAVSKNWTALAGCVTNASSQARNIYNEFVRCWNNARNPFRWLKRTACVTRLIIRLA